MARWKTMRAYNKWRHQYWLGNDIPGNKIYPGDLLRITVRSETTVGHCSQVHWDCLNGAQVQSHPSHKIMDGYSVDDRMYRGLARLLQEQTWTVDTEWKTFVEKITYEEYLKWYEPTKLKYDKYKEEYQKDREDSSISAQTNAE